MAQTVQKRDLLWPVDWKQRLLFCKYRLLPGRAEPANKHLSTISSSSHPSSQVAIEVRLVQGLYLYCRKILPCEGVDGHPCCEATACEVTKLTAYLQPRDHTGCPCTLACMEAKQPVHSANPTGPHGSSLNQHPAISNGPPCVHNASLASNAAEIQHFNSQSYQLPRGGINAPCSDVSAAADMVETKKLAKAASVDPNPLAPLHHPVHPQMQLSAPIVRSTAMASTAAAAAAVACVPPAAIVSQPVKSVITEPRNSGQLPSPGPALQLRQPAAQLPCSASDAPETQPARAIPPPAAAVLAAAAVATQPAQDAIPRSHPLPGVQHVYHDPDRSPVPRVVTGAGIPVPIFPVAAVPLPGASSANAVPQLTPKSQGSF